MLILLGQNSLVFETVSAMRQAWIRNKLLNGWFQFSKSIGEKYFSGFHGSLLGIRGVPANGGGE